MVDDMAGTKKLDTATNQHPDRTGITNNLPPSPFREQTAFRCS